jgi:secondary thiamine-phosphate synthase enzyme
VWVQRRIDLQPRARGFHLITREIVDGVPEIAEVDVGLLHILIAHTTASLALNENASPDVRRDFETYFSTIVPEQAGRWTHTLEGPDDMPSHVKAALLGPSLTLPISAGGLALGTWQGIYLCEHRNRGGSRRVVVTLFGETRNTYDVM